MPSIVNATTTAGVAIQGDNSGVLALQTNNGTTAVTITTGQNVGIGVTATTQKLWVNGNTCVPDDSAFGFHTNPSAGAISNYYSGNDASNYLRMFTGGSERMRITSAGNVGIATTTPQRKLSVVGTDGASGQTEGNSRTSLFLDNNGANYLTIMTSTSGDGGVFFSDNGSNNGGMVYETSSDALYFRANNTERMRIFSNGNLNIGGSSDTGYRLTVNTASSAVPSLYLRSSASGDAGAAQIRLIKNDATNTTSQIFIQFVIDGNNTGSGQINANGASQAAFGSFSDVRLKENIKNLPSQLNNIMALRPVEFDYKNGSGHQIGFIAQEMEQVYPDAIGVGEDEMLTVTGWSKTEARLVKAIQELNAKVEAQAAEIAALKGVK